MTEPIKPATDPEVAWTKERAVVVTAIGSARAQGLVARIEADRATIAELLAALEGLVADSFGCPMCDSGTLRNEVRDHYDDCRWVIARAAILRAKASHA